MSSERIVKRARIEAAAIQIGESISEPMVRLERPDILNIAQTQAAQLLQAAEREAEDIRMRAQTEAEALRLAAREQGFAQGEAEGQARLQHAIEQFHGLLQAALVERERLLSASESEMVHLVLMMVRKILRVEPLINEQTLIRITRHALERLTQRVDVCIAVNPADVELLHFSLTQLQDLALEIVIEPDAKIMAGGCRITSIAGEVDATLETQFEQIARAFLALADGDDDILE